MNEIRSDKSTRFLEFSASHIRNPNTRRTYGRVVAEFLIRCRRHGVVSITLVQPLHGGGYIEKLIRVRSARTIKQCLAATGMLFDWLVE